MSAAAYDSANAPAAPSSVLSRLAELTTIVADTGDLAMIKKYKPTDATTNPSLILKAAQQAEYLSVIEKAIETCEVSIADSKSPWYVKDHTADDLLSLVMDYVSCVIGREISTHVPGYVSTEVDARLSFSTDKTIEKARRLIAIYESLGVSKSRILIKIASTWEGIQAARVLEKEGITCNLTLLFSLVQAVACADASCTLISPFVGRIMDWYKAKDGVSAYEPHEDPGVISVTTVYNYYKKFGHKTIVMGASFRNTGEIKELAGCDRLTIAPALLEEMSNDTTALVKKLDATRATDAYAGKEVDASEEYFRWAMNEDAMATEKLAEGIRNFAKDLVKLEGIMKKMIARDSHAAAGGS